MKKPVTTLVGALNICFIAMLVIAYFMGYLKWLFVSDQTHVICSGIAVFTAISVLLQVRGAWLMDIAAGYRADFLRTEYRLPLFVARIAGILGFVGTVIGLSIAVEGLPTLTTEDTAALAGQALIVMKAGLATAFATTIIGLLARIWIECNWFVMRLFARLPGA